MFEDGTASDRWKIRPDTSIARHSTSARGVHDVPPWRFVIRSGRATPGTSFAAADARFMIEEGLSELSPRQRAAVVLTELLGYSSECWSDARCAIRHGSCTRIAGESCHATRPGGHRCLTFVATSRRRASVSTSLRGTHAHVRTPPTEAAEPSDPCGRSLPGGRGRRHLGCRIGVPRHRGNPAWYVAGRSAVIRADRGTYSKTLTNEDPVVRANDMAGTYVQLGRDGVMLLSIPPGFTAEGSSPSGSASACPATGSRPTRS